MKRTVYLDGGDIRLLYAENEDRELLYNMAFEEDGIWQSMFRKKEDFDPAQIMEEEDHFFGDTPGNSKYLLIEYDGGIVGTISHTYHDGPTKSFELDTWLRSAKYTGKGIGSRTMRMLIDKLVQTYGIKIFLIRPWTKNQRAVKAYMKCGFRPFPGFDAKDFYGKYLEQYGDGDYPDGETLNMILTIE